MKQVVHIAAIVDEPRLLEQMVRQLVMEKPLAGGLWQLPAHLKPVTAASAETYASGVVHLNEGNEQFRIPFITRFLFSCLKNRNAQVSVEWCASLS